MTVYALWWGGWCYSHGDRDNNLERFASVRAARDAFRERYDSNGITRCEFPFANREHESVFTPNVSDGATMHLFMGAHEEDGKFSVGELPDYEISFGPRGGVRVERV